jgi:protein phosphatase
MHLDAAAYTHVGLVRQNNEDNFYLQGNLRQDLHQQTLQIQHRGNDRMALYAVADGMGGEENGELASLVTVQNLKGCQLSDVQKLAGESISRANELICDEINRCGGVRMGSTLAAVYMDAGSAICCNVGDSRVYLFRRNTLRQLSVDHTQVQQMVRSGLLTAQEARTHKRRHVLTQNIGIFPDEMDIEPAFHPPIPLEPGDLFLLCSDGLTDMADDDQIAAVLQAGGTPKKLAEELVALALAQGGGDNVTVLLIRASRRHWPFPGHDG